MRSFAVILLAWADTSVASTADMMLPSMWSEMKSHCASGNCRVSEGSKIDPMSNSTDCHGRLLAYEYGLKTLPDRHPLLEVFDALSLQTDCGISRPHPRHVTAPMTSNNLFSPSDTNTVIYVDVNKGSDIGSRSGSEISPLATLEKALNISRSIMSPRRTIVLQPGVHFLNDTIKITAADNGLVITAAHGSAPGSVVVSGGVELNPKWQKSTRKSQNPNVTIWETDIVGLDRIAGLTTLSPHRRVTRAREPNALPSQGAELCTQCWNNKVTRWHANLACVGKARTLYKDLRDCNNDMKLPDGSPCKNDSAMWDTYNTYSNGHGGCCAAWPGDWSPYGRMGNYFCGNSSAGGWVGFNDPRGNPGDPGYNGSQGLSAQLPYGFDFDPTSGEPGHEFLSTMVDPGGAIFHVWRAQGWFVNMFEVSAKKGNSIEFSTWKDDAGLEHPVGGWQGGRGWQINASAMHDPHSNYLLASKWMIENVFEALDIENEWFYDEEHRKLYLIPNVTSNIPPPADITYVAVKLQTLININGTKEVPVRDVVINGLTFRDAADITMEAWGVPSGGDWGLYRGGAISIEGAENITIKNNVLTRIDGNGVFLSGYTRDIEISDNEFSWIGCSPMAAWGYTNETDGTDGLQPRWTKILRNFIHEFGHYEKQSSAWFQAKACLTEINNNIIFNGPRAGINFNDGFGGGTNVSQNLIFNQCRESGDHGAMNSWDRTSYLSDVKFGSPSYVAQMNSVNNNFVIANYGASQGFDTDDGSSWYNIHDNFFFMADAWKMDYGGHDSNFYNNVVYHGHNDGQNCVNTWPFLPGHGANYSGNKCILPKSTNIGNVGDGIVPALNCPGNAKEIPPWDPKYTMDTWRAECGITFSRNEYYTSDPSATTVNCNCSLTSPDSNNCASGPRVQPNWNTWKAHGNDVRSTLSNIPTDDELIGWAREKLWL